MPDAHIPIPISLSIPRAAPTSLVPLLDLPRTPPMALPLPRARHCCATLPCSSASLLHPCCTPRPCLLDLPGAPVDAGARLPPPRGPVLQPRQAPQVPALPRAPPRTYIEPPGPWVAGCRLLCFELPPAPRSPSRLAGSIFLHLFPVSGAALDLPHASLAAAALPCSCFKQAEGRSTTSARLCHGPPQRGPSASSAPASCTRAGPRRTAIIMHLQLLLLLMPSPTTT